MKRTVALLGLAFLVSIVAFLSFVGPVRAPLLPPGLDEDDVWSEPNGYASAYVRGTYNRNGPYPWKYYRIHHEADIFECLRGRYQFFGKDISNNLVYSYYGVIQNGATYVESDPPYYNTIVFANTETWAPYYYPPSPYMEYAHACIGLPGWL
jgi:hypothetical protein